MEIAATREYEKIKTIVFNCKIRVHNMTTLLILYDLFSVYTYEILKEKSNLSNSYFPDEQTNMF